MIPPYRCHQCPAEEKKDPSMPSEAEMNRKSEEAAHKRVVRGVCLVAAMLFGTSAFLGRKGCDPDSAAQSAMYNKGYVECMMREHPAK